MNSMKKTVMASIVLMHLALLVIFIGCIATAQRPGFEVFYFLAGVLCMPVFDSLRDLLKAIKQSIRSS